MTTLELGGDVRIEVASRRGEFLGLGRVRVGGVELRSASRPMSAQVRSPDAVVLGDYRLAELRREGDDVVLALAMSRRDGDLMDWMVHEVHNRRRLGDWTAGPTPAEGTRLELVLRPVRREFGGRPYVGFSYQYRYASRDIPIYRLLDRSTWEIGGRACGNELWLRNAFAPPIARFASPADSYSTEWYLPGIVNPSIFQFIPLQTESQGFTFTAAEAGLLVTWPTEVRHVRSLLEKPRGTDLIVHLHEHCDDLAAELTSSPVEVLFSPGATGRVERANAYEAVRDAVSRHLHELIGMRTERVSTYGMIEEWDAPDMDRYAERGVPALLAAGMRTIGLANHFQNNMNTWGISNMCCTVDLKVSDRVGQTAMRRLCQAAHAGGAVVQMWGNTAISSLTEWFWQRNGPEDRIRFLPKEGSIMDALQNAADPFIRNPSGAFESDHYAPRFIVLNLRDPAVRDYWLRSWRAAHDEIGLDAIFLDSSFNLSSDKLHFKAAAEPAAAGATADQTHLLGRTRPPVEPPAAVLSQYRAHLELMVQMQRMGYQYCGEDVGVFGVHRHGPGIEARLDNLFLWPECLANFDAAAVEAAGHQADDVFFRALACRMMWMIYWDIRRNRLSFHHGGVRGPADEPTAWHLSVLAAFNEADAHMLRRRILPEELGVLWEGEGGREVLWSFADLELPLPVPRTIRDLLAEEGEAEATPPASALRARRRHVYLLTPPGG